MQSHRVGADDPNLSAGDTIDTSVSIIPEQTRHPSFAIRTQGSM
jgi:hypothetical protein